VGKKTEQEKEMVRTTERGGEKERERERGRVRDMGWSERGSGNPSDETAKCLPHYEMILGSVVT